MDLQSQALALPGLDEAADSSAGASRLLARTRIREFSFGPLGFVHLGFGSLLALNKGIWDPTTLRSTNIKGTNLKSLKESEGNDS